LPACGSSRCSRRKSLSEVTTTRSVSLAWARYASSGALSSSTSVGVVTSIPRRRSASATAYGTCSSSRKRTLRTLLLQLLRERSDIGTAKLLDKGAFPRYVTLDLVAVIPIIGEGGVDVCKGDGGMLIRDLVCGHAELLMPDGNVLHPNPLAGDAWFRPAGPADDFNVLPNDIHRVCPLS